MPAASGASGTSPGAIGAYLLSLMLRNISTSGSVVADHNQPGNFSAPGCVLASPSWPRYPGNVAPISQDYVFNWTRDAAITVSTVLAQPPDLVPAEVGTQILSNYVNFARQCQEAGGLVGQAKYTPEGEATGVADESDGPALRVLTVLAGFARLDSTAQDVAQAVVATDLGYLLDNDRYQQPTVTLWEDTYGQSIFARAVQLRCFDQLVLHGASMGIPVPPEAKAAATWLGQQLPGHWDAPAGHYRSVLGAIRLTGDPAAAYDPSVDPVLACIYGDGVACTDVQLLSTAAQARAQWATGGAYAYPINSADAAQGRGPLVGRYLGDEYDGLSLTGDTGHPWAVCTCSFAQLYYELARAIKQGAAVPSGPLAAPFLAQVGVTGGETAPEVIAALQAGGDGMLNAVVYHSNYLELSEQFDQATGFERSVANLTWSYAAFLSALAARG